MKRPSKEIEELREQQAVAPAESHRNLALAVRNDRIIAAVSRVAVVGALAKTILR